MKKRQLVCWRGFGRIFLTAAVKLPLRLSGLVANPFKSPCCDEANNQKIVSAETCRVLPVVAFLVGSLKCHIEQGTFLGLLTPNAGTDGTMADGVDGFVIGGTSCCLIFHDVCFVTF